MSKVKIGVIGCGSIANSAHIPAYVKNEDAEIKYFCDIKLDRAEKAVKDYNCGTAVEDYHVVINDPEIDAVSVCTPNNMHSIISIDAMRAGKHVLCEKPTARVLSEALEMQKVAHETGKILNIGVVNRFSKSVNMIKDMISNGELGDIYHVYIAFRSQRSIPGLGGAFTTKSIAGGGVLIDWGVHYIDIAMYCLGDPEPRAVSGKAYCALGKDIEGYTYVNMWAGPPVLDGTGVYDVDDFVTALVRTDNTTISMNGAWAQNIGEGESYIDFIGTKAGVRLNYGGYFTKYSTENGALTEMKPQYKAENIFENEINAFVKCVQTGEHIQSYTDSAIITAKLMQAIYDSSDRNEEVKL